MAKITTIIQPSNFELVRDRIAAILSDEINNQVLLSGNYEIDAQVFIERNIQVDKSETPLINVSLSASNFDSKNQGDVRNTSTYFIDVYTNAPTTAGMSGDTKSNYKLQRLLGICRAILENPIYKTLEFTPPSISRTLCSQINIRAMDNNDATNSCMGRIQFEVVIHETTALLSAPIVQSYYTTVLLNLTNQGYVWDGRKLADFNNDFNKDYNTL